MTYLYKHPIKECSQCHNKRNIPSHTTLCIDCFWNPKTKKNMTERLIGDGKN